MTRLPDPIRQQVEQLLTAGHSDRDIHRQTGAARTTIARYRTRLGLPGWQTTADSETCRHGHAFPQNLARSREGWIYCLECKRIRDRARYVPVTPDEAAIDRATAGDPPERLSPRERRAAVHQLDAQRLPASVIAARVRCSKRTVHRVRAKGVTA